MCTGGCAKCLGGTLIPLAVLCALANILLFFPGGKVADDSAHITTEVWYFGGILGSGVLMIFPALVFLGLQNNDCCGCCGNQGCGKRFAMFSSIIFAAVGVVGAGYCFILSAVAINKGPICQTATNWTYPFENGVLKELTDGIAKPFFTFEKSWQSGGAPGGWKRGNNTPIFKKGRKEDSGDPQPASLTSVPEIMEQFLLEGLMVHMEHRGVIWQPLPDQPMAFYDGVDNGGATEVIYPGTIPHSILLSKLERDDFRGELLDGEGSGWMVPSRGWWSVAQDNVLMDSSDKRCP
ncbi:hypothetical protein HGM15179_015020 [Zosterops borbonicus]|uniref:Transmembrane 4 L6 family member 4 n=1 Tax=Zosterops borbonicus TaxID=364589 RepID=A0A8K1G5G1_9PASS|nr:hypothetical protein HGM15179_015020 [Zosterops borbonicus]